MNIILPGDKDYESRPSIQRKSLRINLNENIYGTFVEIGAGQGKSVGMLGRDSGLRLLGPFADLSGHERCLQFQKEL